MVNLASRRVRGRIDRRTRIVGSLAAGAFVVVRNFMLLYLMMLILADPNGGGGLRWPCCYCCGVGGDPRDHVVAVLDVGLHPRHRHRSRVQSPASRPHAPGRRAGARRHPDRTLTDPLTARLRVGWPSRSYFHAMTARLLTPHRVLFAVTSVVDLEHIAAHVDHLPLQGWLVDVMVCEGAEGTCSPRSRAQHRPAPGARAHSPRRGRCSAPPRSSANCAPMWSSPPRARAALLALTARARSPGPAPHLLDLVAGGPDRRGQPPRAQDAPPRRRIAAACAATVTLAASTAVADDMANRSGTAPTRARFRLGRRVDLDIFYPADEAAPPSGAERGQSAGQTRAPGASHTPRPRSSSVPCPGIGPGPPHRNLATGSRPHPQRATAHRGRTRSARPARRGAGLPPTHPASRWRAMWTTSPSCCAAPTCCC